MRVTSAATSNQIPVGFDENLKLHTVTNRVDKSDVAPDS